MRLWLWLRERCSCMLAQAKYFKQVDRCVDDELHARAGPPSLTRLMVSCVHYCVNQ